MDSITNSWSLLRPKIWIANLFEEKWNSNDLSSTRFRIGGNDKIGRRCVYFRRAPDQSSITELLSTILLDSLLEHMIHDTRASIVTTIGKSTRRYFQLRMHFFFFFLHNNELLRWFKTPHRAIFTNLLWRSNCFFEIGNWKEKNLVLRN